MFNRIVFLVISIGITAEFTTAETIRLKDGQVAAGTILQQGPDFITLALDYCLVRIPRSDISSIELSKDAVAERKNEQARQHGGVSRLPCWSRVIRKLLESYWGGSIAQIPATVVDKGVLRNVPYMSFRCGKDGEYEINIYGDPDDPSGIEIGVYGQQANDSALRRRCVDFIASVLADKTDKGLVKVAKFDGDRIDRDGLTIEITPPTAEDSYGGWWVSAYYVDRLERIRAPDQEIDAIAISINESRQFVEVAPKSEQTPKAKTEREKELDTSWTRNDFDNIWVGKSSSNSSSGTGRVYVRGYFRKDGTYVHPHTRSRPRR